MHHWLDSALQIEAQYISKVNAGLFAVIQFMFNRPWDNHAIVVFSLFSLLQGILYWGVLIRSHLYNQKLNAKHTEMFCLKQNKQKLNPVFMYIWHS